jgi:hypothetical protein
LHLQGTEHQFTVAYTPEQNGLAERFNKTIVTKLHSIIIEACLPKWTWGEALLCSTYLYNRTPHSTIKWQTPFQQFYGRIPSIIHLHKFGSVAYKHVPKQLRKKLEPHAIPYIFMGYDEHSKAYRLLDLTTKNTIIARDIIFLDNPTPAFNLIDHRTGKLLIPRGDALYEVGIYPPDDGIRTQPPDDLNYMNDADGRPVDAPGASADPSHRDTGNPIIFNNHNLPFNPTMPGAWNVDPINILPEGWSRRAHINLATKSIATAPRHYNSAMKFL